MNTAIVSGAFDDLRSPDLRFLQEAAKLGTLTVLLWTDEAIQVVTGRPPRFPLAERRYFVEAVRYVANVTVGAFDDIALCSDLLGSVWVDAPGPKSALRQEFCRIHGIDYRVLADADLAGFPEPPRSPTNTQKKKVVATGCFDWLHSGHVRFFEEAAALGGLYVIVGHDANIRHLKGTGHPLQPDAERCYCVGTIRHVEHAQISSGVGWLDAQPEIEALEPDFYVVNEDGDHAAKREYCRATGIEYIVLRRRPAPGLPRRSSTELRGF